jgi:hypothetical protein
MAWWLLFLVAVGGFAASATVHVAAWCGVDVASLWPSYAVVHLILFVPVIGAILTARAADRRAGSTTGNPFAIHPLWMRRALIAMFIYALLNFAYFAFRQEGMPAREPDGTYALRNKGKFVRTISTQEYHAHRALHARGISGHWMLFYFLAAGILLDARHRPARTRQETDSLP